MANWRKVLVSGSNIEVNQISGSALNLSDFSATAEENKVLIVGVSGSITAVAQNTLDGAQQSFKVRGDADAGSDTTFASDNTLLFDTVSANHGFSFDVTDDLGGTTGLTSVRLSTPQDLREEASPIFKSMSLSTDFGIRKKDKETAFLLKDNTFEIVVDNNGQAIQYLNASTVSDNYNFLTVNTGKKGLDFVVAGSGSDGRAFLLDVGHGSTGINSIYSGSVLIGGTATSDRDFYNMLTVSGSTRVIGAISASQIPTASSTDRDWETY